MATNATVMTEAARREGSAIRSGVFTLNTPRSRLHQRPGRFQIGRANGLGGPVCQRARQTHRVVTDILWKDARTHDEHIVCIPGLQKAINHAAPGILTHDRSADIVRGLVYPRVVMITE